MLTPAKIKNHHFEIAGKNAYKAQSVDEFFEIVADSYDQMFRENGELVRKISALAETIDAYKSDEDNIRAALVNAQRMADQIIKEAQAKAFAELGAEYIDSAMLGSLMALGHKVPILASGKDCKKWHDLMTPFNMKITLVNPDDPDNTKAGEASKIKLVRSVFMKGIEGLIVETLLFARKCGVEDYILSSISNSMNRDKFEDIALRMAGADLIHSERRSFEVGESMELMKEVGVEPLMAMGTKEQIGRAHV